MKKIDTKANAAASMSGNSEKTTLTKSETSVGTSDENEVNQAPLVSVRYAEIILHLTMSAEREDKRRLGGALRSLMSVMGRGPTDDADLAPENLSATFQIYFQHPTITALCTATQNNRRSAIRALSEVYTELQQVAVRQTYPFYNPFWAEVMLAAAAPEVDPAFRTYLRGRRNEGYMPRSLASLKKLSDKLNIPSSRLEQHCWFWKPTQLFDLRNPAYNWVDGHNPLTRIPYALSELPIPIEVTLAPFFKWRRMGSKPRLEVTHLDGSTHSLLRKGGWTLADGQSPGEVTPTETLFKEFLRSFFGFMSMPPNASDPKRSGRGVAVENLELAHLFVGSNVTAFCDFYKARNGRFDHTGLQRLRQDWCTLIGSLESYGRHAQTALLATMTAVLGPGAVPKTPAEWSAWCDKQLQDIDDWIAGETQGRTGAAKFRKARCVAQSLEFLLSMDRPMEEVVWPTVFWLKENRPPSYYPIRDRFNHETMGFTVAAFACEPCRQKNWRSMLWHKHVYKRDGKWYLSIDKNRFKNRRVLEHDYKSRIEDTGQEFFEAFYQVWKEQFGLDPLAPENHNKPCFVMAAWGCSPHDRPGNTMLTTRLNFLKVVWNVTINPHAFRHIWATDWLKRHTDDFYTVAGKLNDKVAMVMREYGHLRSSDHAARANRGNMGLAERAQANLKKRTGKT